MSASQHLVLTRTGRDLRANADVPPAVPVLELLEVAQATLHADHRQLPIEQVHPRQASDELNFTSRGSAESATTQRPFSFDPRGLSAAFARQQRFETSKPFLAQPLAERDVYAVSIEQLQTFFRAPVRYFFNERLDVMISQARDSTPDHFPVELNPLESWQIGMDLIEAGLSKANADRYIRIQQARGALPPGRLGDAKVAELRSLVGEMFEAMAKLGVVSQTKQFQVAASIEGVELGGNIVSWSAGSHPGPIDLTYSKSDGRHKLLLWLNLLAMTATDPSQDWRALGVAKDPRNSKSGAAKIISFKVKGTSEQERQTCATAGLALALALYKLGLREPLPLFAKSSYELAHGKRITGTWDGEFFAERADAYHAEVFGHLDSLALLEIPLLGNEPFGNGDDRTTRFAHVLWDAVSTTTIDIDPDVAPKVGLQ